MKVRSYLNDVPFDELSYEEKLKFSIEVQIRMLKMAGYTPIEVEDADTNKKWRPSKTTDLEVRYKVSKRYKELKSYRKVALEFDMSKGEADQGKLLLGPNQAIIRADMLGIFQ